MRVGVVGAGLGGLSAAAHLVAGGHQVTVFERRSGPGGLATSVVEDGFRLDLGPTVVTMPDLLAAPFRALGSDLDRHVVLERLDTAYRAVFADGSEFRVRAGRDAMVDEVRSFAGAREAANFEAFADWLTELWELEMPTFIDRQYDGVADLRHEWRPLFRLARRAGFRRLDQAVSSFLEDQRLQRVFSFQSLYAGVAPQDALSLYAVITYMDTIAGVFSVRGGVSAVASSLASLLERRGASFEYDRAVTRIRRNGGGAVAGVEIDGDAVVPLDAVVVNADVAASYRTLLDVRVPRRLRHGVYSPSCVVWAAGLRGPMPDGVEHHNVHFGWEWDDAFRALGDGRRMPDPSTFVSVPSIGDTTAAPPGSASVFALEPVPNLRGQVDWSSDSGRILDDLRRRLGVAGYPVGDVVVERSIDPLGWRALGYERGTPFSLAHVGRQTGPLRPRNVVDDIGGLAFAGAGTTPGLGIPMVLLSGKLAAQRVDAYAAATRTVRW
jgi:phytoene desaturase